MVNPVKGRKITTPYGKRGKYWSCKRVNGLGVHTGADIAAPKGTKVVAARPGVVRHVNFGKAFGNSVLVVTKSGKTGDHYAHLTSRVKNGTKVKAGDKIGTVGATGNVTGPHLHFERLNLRKGIGWSCSKIQNPAKSIAWKK